MAYRKHSLGLEVFLINKLGKGLNLAAGHVHRFASQVKQISASMAFGASNLISGSAQFASVAAAGMFANMAIESVRAFNRIEKKWIEVTTLMPLVTKKSTDQMFRNLRAFGKEAALGLEDVMGAAYQAISAQVDPEQIVPFFDVASQAAIGGVTDLFTATDALTTTLNAYNAEVDKARAASDALFTTVLLGKTTFRELAPTIGRVLPLANALGININEIGSAIASLTLSGLQTPDAVTYLRQMLKGLLEPTAEMERAFKAIGVNLAESLEENDLATVMLQIGKAAEASGQNINELFGRIQGATAATILSTNEAKENWEKFTLYLEGSTEQAFQKVEDSASRNLDKVSAMFKQLKTNMGDFFSAIVGYNLTGAAKVADAWDWSTEKITAGGFGKIEPYMQQMNDPFMFAPMEKFATIYGKKMSDGWENVTTNVADGARKAREELDKVVQANRRAMQLWNNAKYSTNFYDELKRTEQAARDLTISISQARAASTITAQATLGSEYQMYETTGFDITRAISTWTPPSTRSSGGGGGSSFDLNAVMYEFGDLLHDDYLSILRPALERLGGRFTEAGAEVYRTIMEVEEDKKALQEENMAKEAELEAARREALDNLYTNQMISEESYLWELHRRLENTRAYTDEWMSLWDQINELTAQKVEEARRVEDAKHSLGDIGDEDYLKTLKKRLDDEEEWSEEWVHIKTQIKNIQDRRDAEARREAEAAKRAAEKAAREKERAEDQARKDADFREDLQHEYGEISTQQYLAILESRITEFGGKYTREGSTAYRKMVRLLDELAGKEEKQVIEVKLDIDTNDALLVRADTVRYTTRREANRRGKPLASLPVS